jgi:antitoxin component YwqK of YwqJK toxin-antitoxin module
MSKFVGYNSAEYQILKQAFEKMPMMDAYIANIVEEYIYSNVRETEEEGYIIEYRTKYGKKDGEYKVFFPNGQLSMKTTYVDGKIHGEYTEWYEDCNLAIQTTYVDDKRHGEYKEWYSNEYAGNNNQLWEQKTYKNGKLEGECKKWHINGQQSLQISYVDGKYHGEFIEWFYEGKQKFKVTFVNGEIQRGRNV